MFQTHTRSWRIKILVWNHLWCLGVMCIQSNQWQHKHNQSLKEIYPKKIKMLSSNLKIVSAQWEIKSKRHRSHKLWTRLRFKWEVADLIMEILLTLQMLHIQVYLHNLHILEVRLTSLTQQIRNLQSHIPKMLTFLRDQCSVLHPYLTILLHKSNQLIQVPIINERCQGPVLTRPNKMLGYQGTPLNLA